MNPVWIERQQYSLKIDPQEIFRHYGRAFLDRSLKDRSEQPATVVGMLNADESPSDLDLAFSRHLIDHSLTDYKIPTGSDVDIACAIGRFAVNVFSDDYKQIDLIDPIDGFIVKAAEELTGIVIAVDKFVTNVQDWTPDKHSVTFWCQWLAM
jgi:hypothetical protein